MTKKKGQHDWLDKYIKEQESNRRIIGNMGAIQPIAERENWDTVKKKRRK